jgi:hypothetical protein
MKRTLMSASDYTELYDSPSFRFSGLMFMLRPALQGRTYDMELKPKFFGDK